MSNQYRNQDHETKKGFSKTQKYIPKRDGSNPNPTLPNSYRHSVAGNPSMTSSEDAGKSRLKSTGEEGRWVPNSVAPGGRFVNYLPQDEAVAAGRGVEEGALDPLESQRVVDLLNRELAWLLRLKPRDFWKEVASDSSLHAFIESFLKYRGRWYDFPYRGAKGMVAGAIIGEVELCRRVFMLLYRISSYRDPGARSVDSLSKKDHEALLQEKKLLDLPKLLDICAIYGHENEDLTRLLVTNSIKAQPRLHDEFLAFLSHVLSIVNTMAQRCSSSLEVLASSSELQDQSINRHHSDYLEVMDFVNDAVVTVDAFIGGYEPAAIFFACPVEMSYGTEELLLTLARLHDSLLPSLWNGLHMVLGSEDMRDMLSDAITSLKLLSMRIVKLGWRLIYLCYLSDEAFENASAFPNSMKMFPSTVHDPVIRADILVQTLRDISEACTNSIMGPGKGTFLQNMEKNHKLLARVGLLQNSGWISMDDQQSQFLSSILIHPLEVKKGTPQLSSHSTGKPVQTDEDTAILESKISQIKDLFPDYGKGFLAACLEAYDQNPEEVIQRILDQNLHKDLQSLDISLEAIPDRKTSTSKAMPDKGKAKLLESEPVQMAKGKGKLHESESLQMASNLSNKQETSSISSSVGRFMRKTDNNTPQSQILDSKDQEYMSKTAALISQMEYEDEYDDSFDELGLGVNDSGFEETEATETDSSRSNNATPKWASRKTPQFYVKDGKNYSYKVEGGIAVGNYREANLVNQAQKDSIYGLGRGGNIPLGAVQKLTELNNISSGETTYSEPEAQAGRGSFRGRGRRGGGRNTYVAMNQRPSESQDEGNDGPDTNEAGGRGDGGRGSFSGRGRRGGGRHYRKDQAMKKHLSSLRG